MQTKPSESGVSGGVCVEEFKEDHWRDPLVQKPPMGVGLLVYTCGGITLKSHWINDGSFLGWMPIPKVPKWLKQRALASSLPPGFKPCNSESTVQ